MNAHPRQRLLVGMCVLWSFAITAGSVMMWNYASLPGREGRVPISWPGDAQIALSSQGPTLVMFGHPRCPCTRASIEELARLMTNCQGRVETRMIFFRPSGSPTDWPNTDLWRSAEAIPGVRVGSDDDASEARRFQVETSGHTLLYDKEGHLLFSGGITAARGHAGDNVGREALEALLHGRRAPQVRTPVFGCSLVAPDSQCVTTPAECHLPPPQ